MFTKKQGTISPLTAKPHQRNAAKCQTHLGVNAGSQKTHNAFFK
jgi:hypothetical protein